MLVWICYFDCRIGFSTRWRTSHAVPSVHIRSVTECPVFGSSSSINRSGCVLVTRPQVLDELLDRFDVDAVVLVAVGQEQGFRSDGRLAVPGSMD